MEIKIKVMIISLDWRTGKFFLLQNRDTGDIPEAPLLIGEEPDEVSERISSETTRLSKDWTTTTIIGSYNSNNIISIVYRSLVPYDITIPEEYTFIDISTINIENEKLKNIVLAAIRGIV